MRAVASPRAVDAPRIRDDQSFITLRHANGSVSNVAYLAGGDRAMPKERVEVLGGGRMAVIDDFNSVTLASSGQMRTTKTRGKGHFEEMQTWARVLREGGPAPIAWEELRAVSLAAILAVRSLREGVPLFVSVPEEEPEA